MSTWTVWKFVRENGRCPLDDWLADKSVTIVDRGRLDGRVDAIERLTDLPPETLKSYGGTRLHELKVKSRKKQLRPLCYRDNDKKIIVLCGAFERDNKIPKGTLDTADHLLTEYLNGKGHVRRYLEAEED